MVTRSVMNSCDTRSDWMNNQQAEVAKKETSMEGNELKKTLRKMARKGIEFSVCFAAGGTGGEYAISADQAAAYMDAKGDVEKGAIIYGTTPAKMQKFLEWRKTVDCCAGETAKGTPCKLPPVASSMQWGFRQWEKEPDRKFYCRRHGKEE